MTRLLSRAAAAGALSLCLGSAAQAVTLLGLTSGNDLVRFNSSMPGMTLATTAITGLMEGERLVGIDLRPTDGMIYGVSTAQRIYTIDEMSGMATWVSTLDTAVVNDSLGYGVDFNPSADFAGGSSLRLVTSAGNNFAVNVGTGVVGNQASNIGTGFSGVGYTNSMVGVPPASTALYYINSNTDMLHFAPGSFNAPTIQAVGALGVDVLKANGFEVIGDSMAYAALTVDGATLSTGIFAIDLMTGAATSLGGFDGTLAGLTVSAVPETGTLAMMLAGIAALGGVARRKLR